MAFVVASLEVSSGCRLESPVKFVSTSPSNIGKRLVLRKNWRCGVRIRVCSRIKDLGVGTSDLGYNVGLYGLFSAPVKPSATPKESEADEEKQKYYVNTGYAIRTLREEFPELFYKEPSFDIYREDIVFKDPLNTFIGIENYKSIFWALRLHGRIFFRALWLDIVTVWQPAESSIMIRWTVHGIPRVPWESRGRFDGTSEYKLDKHGKIYEHRVHNIALNAPPKFRVLAVDELIQSIAGSSTPKPTYFEISPSPRITTLSLKFTWAREFLLSVFSVAERSEAGPSRRT